RVREPGRDRVDRRAPRGGPRAHGIRRRRRREGRCPLGRVRRRHLVRLQAVARCRRPEPSGPPRRGVRPPRSPARHEGRLTAGRSRLRDFGTVCQDSRERAAQLGDAMVIGERQDPRLIVDRGTWTYADDPDLIADPWTTWDRLREESRAFVATRAATNWDVWT